MLVVRRRIGESIRIGEDVNLRLLSIGRTNVRLGIEAPRSIEIDMQQPETGESETMPGTADKPKRDLKTKWAAAPHL